MINAPDLARLKWRLGRKLYMDARGEQRSGAIDRNGETFTQQCVVHNTEDAPKLVVLDIGANQGEWTEHLLMGLSDERRTSRRLAVYAFEPVPATAEMFRERLSGLPGREAVEIHECALSETPGSAEIGIYAAGAGTNSMHYAQDNRTAETTVEVKLITLDAFLAKAGIDHVHFAKCDTEGHDAKVIAGAQGSLREGRVDVLQFEYNHRWVLGRAFLKDVFDMIHGLPYTLARVDKSRLTVFEAWHPEIERFFQSNYVLIHQRALFWFPLYRGNFDGANTYA